MRLLCSKVSINPETPIYIATLSELIIELSTGIIVQGSFYEIKRPKKGPPFKFQFYLLRGVLRFLYKYSHISYLFQNEGSRAFCFKMYFYWFYLLIIIVICYVLGVDSVSPVNLLRKAVLTINSLVSLLMFAESDCVKCN